MQYNVGAFVAVPFCCPKHSFILRLGLLSNEDSLLKMYDLPEEQVINLCRLKA